MAPLRRRIGEDAVALGAAGIVIGTALAALGVPYLFALLLAALAVFVPLRFRLVLVACMLLAFIVAPLRGVGERAPAFDPLQGIRDQVLAPLAAAVPGDAGALAAGLTLGDSRYFSPEFRSAMRESGTTHLVALSGFNVALMLGFVRRLLRKRVRRRTEACCGVAFLAGFVLLAGLQPSLVRAALMGTALLAGELLGRRVAPARLLLITAATMLLLEPRWATHLGFILSFIASWALLAIFGDMERLLASGTDIMRTLGRLAAPTLTAQIGVAPALLASVGYVTLSGLILNPLLVPLTPFLTGISGVQLLLAHAAPALAGLTGPLVASALLPVTGGIRLAASIPLTAAFALPAGIAALLYAASVAWSLRYRPRLW